MCIWICLQNVLLDDNGFDKGVTDRFKTCLFFSLNGLLQVKTQFRDAYKRH